MGIEHRAGQITGYDLKRPLGRGSYGEVWEARTGGNVPVALKLIDRLRGEAEALLEISALTALQELSHPNLLPLRDCWVEPDLVVIAMELADGTLRQRFDWCRKNGNLQGIPVHELLFYVRGAAVALDYLHAKGKLHRDVKPDNILLVNTEAPPAHAKVGDWGLLRECQSAQASMTTRGTPAYIAPETWNRNSLPQSDQFSLAVTYAEMRQGKRPYVAGDLVSLMQAVQSADPDLSGLEGEERGVVTRALRRNPAQRFPCCLDFVEALEKAVGLRATDYKPREKVIELFNRPPPLKTGKTKWEIDVAGAAPEVPENRTLEPSPNRTLREPSAPPPPSRPNSGAEFLPPPEPTPTAPPPQQFDFRGQPIAPKTQPTTPRPNPTKPGVPGKPGGGGGGIFGMVLAVLLGLLGAGAVIYFFVINAPHHSGNGTDGAKKDDGPKKEDGPRKDDSPKDKDRGPEPPALTAEEKDWLRQMLAAEKAAEAKTKLKKEFEAATAAGRKQLYEKFKKSSPPEVQAWLPAGLKPSPGAKKVGPKERPLYDHIFKEVGGKKAEFVLVEAEGGPFYVLRDKASNALFEEFARTSPLELEGSKWREGGLGQAGATGAAPSLPVLRVTRPEAEAFAAWLGGQLPTADQLDAAAGLGKKLDGPISKTGKAAVNRRKEGPAPLDAFNDESPLGVRGLSGNGREWTRDNLRANGVDYAVLRGRSYTSPLPLTYKDLKEMKADHLTPRQLPGKASPYTGLRVVIEVRR